MSVIEIGGIDCDIHPAVPSLKALHPYLSDHWRDIIVQRGMHEL
ncbi:MAG: hydrolase, partial [Rhodopila sp.]|nr:hydrolase [Rhodopila sp.]